VSKAFSTLCENEALQLATIVAYHRTSYSPCT